MSAGRKGISLVQGGGLWSVVLATLLAFLAEPARADVFTVGSGGTYATVQLGVNAAIAATDGEHTIRIVDSASYNENVTFSGATATDHLIIEAASGQTPKVYRFDHTDGNELTVRNLTLDGSLGLTGQYGGLRPNYAGDVTVENVTFQNDTGWEQAAIWCREMSAAVTIDGCTFTNISKYAIYRDDVDSQGNMVIQNSTFVDSTSAINDDRDNNTGSFDIRHNLFSKLDGYCYFHDSSSVAPDSSVTIVHNTFYNIGDESWEGLRVRNVTTFGLHLQDNLTYGKTGLTMWTDTPTAIDADYNGFCNMDQVGYWDGATRTLAELNAFADSTGNVENDTEPFVDKDNGDFDLVAESWARTSGSGGGYIGAFEPAAPVGTVITIK